MSRTPRHAAGFARAAGRRRFRAVILDPDTGERVPARASSTSTGRFLNAEEAIGEIVNPDGAGGFEGYYNNPEANAERMRDGMYWTGDLGYRDDDGLLLLRGPQLRLAARRRRELRGRAGRARARPPSRRRARRGLRGAVARGRRRGDGRAAPARRRDVRPRRVRRRSSPRSPTSRRSGCRASCASPTACRRPRRRRC